MSCGVDCRWGSDPKLLGLWCGPAAVALIGPLAWEPPYAMGEAKGRKERRKKGRKEGRKKERKEEEYSAKKKKKKTESIAPTKVNPLGSRHSPPVPRCSSNLFFPMINYSGSMGSKIPCGIFP